jgi:hypothetical protein
LFVFPTHEEVWGHNKMKLLEVNETYPVAKSNAISHGIHAKSIDSAKAGGLQKTVFMCHILASNYSIESFEANLHDKMLFCILLEQEELLLTVVDLVLVLLFVVN